jgi:hypothetical protein
MGYVGAVIPCGGANPHAPARRNGVIGFQMAGAPTPAIPHTNNQGPPHGHHELRDRLDMMLESFCKVTELTVSKWQTETRERFSHRFVPSLWALTNLSRVSVCHFETVSSVTLQKLSTLVVGVGNGGGGGTRHLKPNDAVTAGWCVWVCHHISNLSRSS